MDGDAHEISTPYWIDTDGYTGRDRLMFVCGVEFEMVLALLRAGEPIDRPIRRENESRIRMLCARHKKPCTITTGCDPENPSETWSRLEVE